MGGKKPIEDSVSEFVEIVYFFISFPCFMHFILEQVWIFIIIIITKLFPFDK